MSIFAMSNSIVSNIKKFLWRALGLSSLYFEESIRPVVTSQANAITDSHICRTNDRALFIDMGSNTGQGFRFFSQYYNPNIYDYWLIEPNPNCIDPLRRRVSKLYRKQSWKGRWEIKEVAVFNQNGYLKLYGLVEDKRGCTSQGASVIKDYNSISYISDESRALEVKCVKASELIENASSEYATIVVKMDIESAEHDVIEDLIHSGLISKISHIYVEWHSKYFSGERKDEMRLREIQVKESISDIITDWH